MSDAAPRRGGRRRSEDNKARSAVRVPVMRAARAAWFLDFDGTLVDLAETPDRVRVEAEVVDMVRELESASRGAVALISGRRIEDIDRFFAPLRLPVAGQHGAEMRGVSGRLRQYPANSRGIGTMHGILRAWVAGRPGLLLENKGSTLAVHYRRAPELAEPLGTLMQELVARTHGRYCLQGGKMVFEIRPTGMDKGSAVLEFMREPPFIGRTPAFVGDDITDESAFAAVLSLGGTAVKVGDGDTIAPWRLQSVADVHAWIRSSIAARSSEEEAG